MTDKEVMQQALDALENHPANHKLTNVEYVVQLAAITALMKAIAQPVQPARSAATNRMHTRIAMVQALSWLENHGAVVFSGGGMTSVDSMNAVAKRLRNALASPQPVQPTTLVVQAPVVQGSWDHLKVLMEHSAWGGTLQLEDALANIDDFTAAQPPQQSAQPVQPQRVPLTDEQIDAIADDNNMGSIWYQDDPRQYWCSFARAIEAAHGIKPATEGDAA